MSASPLSKHDADIDLRPDDAEVELTILMPCLNEAETIATCVGKAARFLRESEINGEVLVADNGSSDGSQELAQDLGARVVAIEQRGYGAALIGGTRAARGKFVIIGDADDSYDFLNLMPFLSELRAGSGLVMGNRFQGGIRPGAMPLLHRYVGNPVLSFLGRLFFRVPIGDFHCGLRGYRREAILGLGLVCPGMEFASEMLVKAALAKIPVSEVPTTLSKDGRSRPPHLRTWQDGWRHLRFLLLHSPRWLFFYPGLAVLALGLLGIALLSPGPMRISKDIGLDIHSLVFASFAVLIGAQLISLAVLARRYAALEGFLPPIAFGSALIEKLSLEAVLQIAGILLLTGLSGVVWALYSWTSSGFGPIAYTGFMRVVVVSLTAVTLAFQLASNAFLTSILTIRRPTL